MPMFPPDPARFSTTKVHLLVVPTLVAISRAIASGPPPAGNGTTRRMGLDGQACAAAGRCTATAAANTNDAELNLFMTPALSVALSLGLHVGQLDDAAPL